MTIENRNQGHGGPEWPTIGDTLNFVHRFSGGNHDLKNLMVEYVYQTRLDYIQLELMDEADDVLDALEVRITHKLIEGDRNAHVLGNKRYAEKDRFRNYVVLGRETGNPEIDELFIDIHFLTTLGNDTIDDRISELKHIWEENNPGQFFYPKKSGQTNRDRYV